MKTIFFFILFCISTIYSAPRFDNYFFDKTFRIDYYHTGNADTELITLDQIFNYGIWAGSKINLIDNFNNGRYYIKIYDKSSGELIYSKGFDSYFGEYKTSGETAQKTYQESAIIPSPKNPIIFAIENRNKQNELLEIFRDEIDPSDVSIIIDEGSAKEDKNISIFKSLESGKPAVKTDIAILAEGYRIDEKDKFEKDLKKFTDVFFSIEPYKSNKNKFNFYGVYKASAESGTDEPRGNIFKKTILNTTFNSLGSERYLLTEDNKAMRDLAGNVPYDAIYIMVNHARYGGGGIYNFFCTFTSDNQWHEYLFLHEFGHSFAGLGDEYYTSDVAYNEFYPKGIEPVEPNISALLNPPNVKWEESEGIEIPTPWEKEAYDNMDTKWQEERRELNNKVAKLKREKAPRGEIEEAVNEYNKKDRAHAEEVDEYLRNSKYQGKVGAFEGAGYSSQGLYRPMIDCIMFSKGSKPFCTVCEKAIQKVIDFYSE